jgi:adenosylhomocysteine nucleosidase
MRIGIIAAMQEEIDTLLQELARDAEVIDDGRRTYHLGCLWDKSVVIVFSRWGKVAAATTATHLISDFGIDEVLFTGVAGAAQPGLKVGDVVVGARLWQHDMDARPLFPQHEIPLLRRSSLPAMQSDAANSVRRCGFSP